MDLGIATVMSALIVVVGTILVALVKEVGKTADRAEEDGGRLYAQVGDVDGQACPRARNWRGRDIAFLKLLLEEKCRM